MAVVVKHQQRVLLNVYLCEHQQSDKTIDLGGLQHNVQVFFGCYSCLSERAFPNSINIIYAALKLETEHIPVIRPVFVLYLVPLFSL